MKIRCNDCCREFTVTASWNKTGWRYKFGCHCEQVDMLFSLAFEESMKKILNLKKCWEIVKEN